MLFVPPDAAMKVRWLHSAALLCRTTSFYLIPSFLFFFPRGPRSADQVRQVTRESQGWRGPYCAPWGAWFESAVTLETHKPINNQWVTGGSFCRALRRKRYDLYLRLLTNQPIFPIFIELFPLTNTTHSSNGVIQ